MTSHFRQNQLSGRVNLANRTPNLNQCGGYGVFERLVLGPCTKTDSGNEGRPRDDFERSNKSEIQKNALTYVVICQGSK